MMGQASVADKAALVIGLCAATAFSVLTAFLIRTDLPERSTEWQRKLFRVTDEHEKDALASQQVAGLIIASLGSGIIAILILISLISTW